MGGRKIEGGEVAYRRRRQQKHPPPPGQRAGPHSGRPAQKGPGAAIPRERQLCAQQPAQHLLFDFHFLNTRKIEAHAAELVAEFDVRPTDINYPAGSLFGRQPAKGDFGP